MKLSKLDVAKGQLDTAINLYFKDGDPVSIHTLTAAAHQVLMDISEQQGVKSFMKRVALTIIKKDKVNDYLLMINEAENFFKHANRDGDALLEFYPDQTDFLLFDAIEMYMQVTKHAPDDMSIYRAWIFIQYPEILTDETKNGLRKQNIDFMSYAKMNRSKFYISVKDALFRR